MVLKIISFLPGEIICCSKTSKPRRNGTLMRFSLLNSGLPLFITTSEISKRAALLPMSIAASLIYCAGFSGSRNNFTSQLLQYLESGFCIPDVFLIEVIIYFDLRSYLFLFVIAFVFITQFIIKPSCLYVVR